MIAPFACIHEVRRNMLWSLNIKKNIIFIHSWSNFMFSIMKNVIIIETTLSFDMYLGNEITLDSLIFM